MPLMDAKIHGLLEAVPAILATVIVSWHGLSSIKVVAGLSDRDIYLRPAEFTVALSSDTPAHMRQPGRLGRTFSYRQTPAAHAENDP